MRWNTAKRVPEAGPGSRPNLTVMTQAHAEAEPSTARQGLRFERFRQRRGAGWNIVEAGRAKSCSPTGAIGSPQLLMLLSGIGPARAPIATDIGIAGPA